MSNPNPLEARIVFPTTQPELGQWVILRCSNVTPEFEVLQWDGTSWVRHGYADSVQAANDEISSAEEAGDCIPRADAVSLYFDPVKVEK